MRIKIIGLLTTLIISAFGSEERAIDKLIVHLASQIAKTVEVDKKILCLDIENFGTNTPSLLGCYLTTELSNNLAKKLPNSVINPFQAERKIADELTYHLIYPTPESLYSSFHNDYSLSGYYTINETERKIKVALTVSDALNPSIRCPFTEEAVIGKDEFAELLEWHYRIPKVTLSDEASKFLTDNGTSAALMKKVDIIDKEGRPTVDSLNIGELCWIKVDLYESAYIYVIGFDRQVQMFYLLYPGLKEMNNFFSGNVYIPSTRSVDRTIGIKMVPPGGFNWFKVIATKKKIEWESIRFTPDEYGVMWLKDEDLLTFTEKLNGQSGGWQAVLAEVWIEE